ncbi:MAG: mechanosensitive ion channel family protein, partial [Xanthomonadaceae bacterium]|nr:mechanosensitive ion channel family protein [Xanthomonadaceae bacterium]
MDRTMKEQIPSWTQEWLNIIVPTGQVLLIQLIVSVLHAMLRRLFRRVEDRYSLPSEMMMGIRRITSFLIYSGALLLILERLGVSGTVLWTAFTGFAAVAAVAFFAAWSVLSNIFCTLLIFTTRPFRINDYVEILENGEKPGLKGKIIDINLIYSTLQEPAKDGMDTETVLQVPNNLFFQRILRRWRGGTDSKS